MDEYVFGSVDLDLLVCCVKIALGELDGEEVHEKFVGVLGLASSI